MRSPMTCQKRTHLGSAGLSFQVGDPSSQAAGRWAMCHKRPDDGSASSSPEADSWLSVRWEPVVGSRRQ